MSNKVSLERHVFIRKIQNNISVMVIPVFMWYNLRAKGEKKVKRKGENNG